MAKKIHQCCRCKAHKQVVETIWKTGRRRNYCAKCVAELTARGAQLQVAP